MSKKDKAVATTAPTTNKHVMPLSGWYGIFLFFVCASIIYANYMVFVGLPFTWLNVSLLAPSTLFVAGLALYKFIK